MSDAIEKALHRAVVRRCLAGQRIIRNSRGQLVLRPQCYADRKCCTCYAEHEAALRQQARDLREGGER